MTERAQTSCRSLGCLLVAALLLPSIAVAGASDPIAEAALDEMVEFYRARRAMAATVEVVVGPSADPDESVDGLFRFFAEPAGRMSRTAFAESEIAATASFDYGSSWTNGAPDLRAAALRETFEDFLDRDRCGYWFLMNQFADPRPDGGWRAPGGAVSLAGEGEVDGVVCRRLAIHAPPRRYELWIDLGPMPIARRATLASSTAPGEPAIVVGYGDWSFDEEAFGPESWPNVNLRRIGELISGHAGPWHGLPKVPLGAPDPVEAVLRETAPAGRVLRLYRPPGAIQLQAFFHASPAPRTGKEKPPNAKARDEETRAYLDCLQGLEEEYRHCGVTLLGVRVGDLPNRHLMGQWRSELGWSFRTHADPVRWVAQRAGIGGLPSLLVIGPDGMVAAKFDSSRVSLRPRVKSVIERLLADQPRCYTAREANRSFQRRLEQATRPRPGRGTSID